MGDTYGSGLDKTSSGGEGGIRTPDTVTRMPHFECGAFNHSATSPRATLAGVVWPCACSLNQGTGAKQAHRSTMGPTKCCLSAIKATLATVLKVVSACGLVP
jgi:hypothetical protein